MLGLEILSGTYFHRPSSKIYSTTEETVKSKCGIFLLFSLDINSAM